MKAFFLAACVGTTQFGGFALVANHVKVTVNY